MSGSLGKLLSSALGDSCERSHETGDSEVHLLFKHKDTVNAGHHVIYTGDEYDSHLLVPAVPV